MEAGTGVEPVYTALQAISNPNFYNTCAIRLSVALFGANHQNPGKWPIKTGKIQGPCHRATQRSQHEPTTRFGAAPRSSITEMRKSMIIESVLQSDETCRPTNSLHLRRKEQWT